MNGPEVVKLNIRDRQGKLIKPNDYHRTLSQCKGQLDMKITPKDRHQSNNTWYHKETSSFRIYFKISQYKVKNDVRIWNGNVESTLYNTTLGIQCKT